MKNQTQIDRENNAGHSARRDLFALEDRVDDAVFRGSALLEALAALVKAGENSDEPLLSNAATEGLQSLAAELGANMRDQLSQLRETTRRHSNVTAVIA